VSLHSTQLLPYTGCLYGIDLGLWAQFMAGKNGYCIGVTLSDNTATQTWTCRWTGTWTWTCRLMLLLVLAHAVLPCLVHCCSGAMICCRAVNGAPDCTLHFLVSVGQKRCVSVVEAQHSTVQHGSNDSLLGPHPLCFAFCLPLIISLQVAPSCPLAGGPTYLAALGLKALLRGQRQEDEDEEEGWQR